jgi:undecaprenyl-diphosphatase
MTVFQSILLGIVQGITEFLPISSSGHLVIVPYLLNWNLTGDEAFVFDVLVQVATLAGVFAFFWRDFYRIISAMLHALRERRPFETGDARLGWYILLSTIPAGLVGIFVKDRIELAFASPVLAAVALLFTAGLLVIAERIGRQVRNLEEVSWKDGLVIGFFQILALLPGLSRSGATITGGMTRDLKRATAARFSFLMSVPILFAAGSVSVVDLLQLENLANVLPAFLPGFIAAGIVGYLSIGWLLRILTKYPLYIFSGYCLLISLITLLVFYLRG